MILRFAGALGSRFPLPVLAGAATAAARGPATLARGAALALARLVCARSLARARRTSPPSAARELALRPRRASRCCPSRSCVGRGIDCRCIAAFGRGRLGGARLQTRRPRQLTATAHRATQMQGAPRPPFGAALGRHAIGAGISARQGFDGRQCRAQSAGRSGGQSADRRPTPTSPPAGQAVSDPALSRHSTRRRRAGCRSAADLAVRGRISAPCVPSRGVGAWAGIIWHRFRLGRVRAHGCARRVKIARRASPSAASPPMRLAGMIRTTRRRLSRGAVRCRRVRRLSRVDAHGARARGIGGWSRGRRLGAVRADPHGLGLVGGGHRRRFLGSHF
jgi:hypothetical protein